MENLEESRNFKIVVYRLGKSKKKKKKSWRSFGNFFFSVVLNQELCVLTPYPLVRNDWKNNRKILNIYQSRGKK